MIEFGAHPNFRGVIDHVNFKGEEVDDHWVTSMVYIHRAESVGTIRATAAVVENACVSLAVLGHSKPAHPARDELFHKTWDIHREFQREMEVAGYLTRPYE